MGKRTDPDKITLGSGKAYVLEYSGTMPSVDDICKPDNMFVGLFTDCLTVIFGQKLDERDFREHKGRSDIKMPQVLVRAPFQYSIMPNPCNSHDFLIAHNIRISFKNID